MTRRCLKIWIDVLTPKQLIISDFMIRKLKGHKILLTSRRYGEVTGLPHTGTPPILVGRHGGATKAGKLAASIARISALLKMVNKFAPDVVLSSASPEAARVAFGLGIRHVAFWDAPHHDAAMRLTMPFIQKLFVPYVIPKTYYTRYGIDPERVTQYKAIDAFVTIKRKYARGPLPFGGGNQNILIRVEEEEAAYTSRSSQTIPMIRRIIDDHPDDNVVILARYAGQVSRLRRQFGRQARVTRMAYDGRYLLENTDVFVGSGGTMTYESALMGVPTISYNAVPNMTEKFLVKRGLVYRRTAPLPVSRTVSQALEDGPGPAKKRARIVLAEMRDPIPEIVRGIKGS